MKHNILLIKVEHCLYWNKQIASKYNKTQKFIPLSKKVNLKKKNHWSPHCMDS